MKAKRESVHKPGRTLGLLEDEWTSNGEDFQRSDVQGAYDDLHTFKEFLAQTAEVSLAFTKIPESERSELAKSSSKIVASVDRLTDLILRHGFASEQEVAITQLHTAIAYAFIIGSRADLSEANQEYVRYLSRRKGQATQSRRKNLKNEIISEEIVKGRTQTTLARVNRRLKAEKIAEIKSDAAFNKAVSRSNRK